MGITARTKSVEGLLLLAGALLLFVRLGGGSLVNEDEARYALVAQEMIESGDPWTPTLRDEPWFNKAPLRIWCTAALGSVFGVDPWTVRLPSAVFALGTVGLVLALGRTLFGVASARWGAFVLLGSTLFVHHHCGRTGETDSALLFFWVLAVWAAARSGGEARAGGVGDGGAAGDAADTGTARWLLLAGAATGAAAMVKHLFYIVPVGGTALLAMMLVGVGRDARAGRRSMPWRRVLEAVGVAVLVLAPWHLAMLALHGRAFLDTYLGREVAHRVAVDHAAGLDPTLPLRVLVDGLYPWVVVMAALAAGGGWRWWRRWTERRRGRASLDPGSSAAVPAAAGLVGARSSAAEPSGAGFSAAGSARAHAVLLLALWAALVVIGVWITRVELSWYVLGAVPPLALLGGRRIATERLPWPLIVLVSAVIALSPSNVTWFDPQAVRAVNGRLGVDLFGVLQGADPWWPAVAVGVFCIAVVGLVRHDPIERRRVVLAAWGALALLQVALPLADPAPSDPLDRLVDVIQARGRAPQHVAVVADDEERRPDLDLYSLRRLELPWRIVDRADDLRPAPDRWILVRTDQAPSGLGRTAQREGPWWLVPPTVVGVVPRDGER